MPSSSLPEAGSTVATSHQSPALISSTSTGWAMARGTLPSPAPGYAFRA